MAGELPRETEVKLRLDDAESGRRVVTQLGAFLVEPRHFEDNVLFDDAARGLAGRGALIRLRETPWAATLTYKGPREVVEGVKRREEVECRVEDAEALRVILGRLGLRSVFRYQKYREVYELDDVEIVIDETPIGAFLEIEGPVEAIHRAADAMGFGAESYVVESYAALFAAAGGEGDMVFG
jgi:adenylate cyclase class 2